MLYLKLILRPLLVMSLIALPLNALAEAGKAIFVLGKVHVESADGANKALHKGVTLESGDAIVTSARGQAQLRMADGTLIAVRPNSRFVIEEFKYDKNKETDKTIYGLVKGGFRSITGKIGKENKKSYGVKTVVGTIGIRGTDFSAFLCDVDCGDNDSGLYAGVMDGGITITNEGGEVSLDPGEYGYVQDISTQPLYLESAPGDLLFADTSTTNTSGEEAVVDNGQNGDVTLDAQGEFIVADIDTSLDQVLIEPEVIVPSTGSYNMTTGTITDGTNTASLTSASLDVDFQAATVSTSLTGSVGSVDNYTWSATSDTGTLDMSTGAISGTLTASVSGGTIVVVNEGGSGDFTGSLGSTLNSSNVPTDANYSYNLTSNSTSGASGTADFALTSFTTQAQ